jgi:hypothetical protein
MRIGPACWVENIAAEHGTRKRESKITRVNGRV